MKVQDSSEGDIMEYTPMEDAEKQNFMRPMYNQ